MNNIVKIIYLIHLRINNNKILMNIMYLNYLMKKNKKNYIIK